MVRFLDDKMIDASVRLSDDLTGGEIKEFFSLSHSFRPGDLKREGTIHHPHFLTRLTFER